MPKHKVYRAIVDAVKQGRLHEPFGESQFRVTYPGFGEGTYKTFLYKHRNGNPGKNSELFQQVAPGRFWLIRPYKFGFISPIIRDKSARKGRSKYGFSQ